VDRGWDEGEAEAMRTNFKTKLVCNKELLDLEREAGMSGWDEGETEAQCVPI